MVLSIITVNRNNAEGLRKTIESVVAQTFTDYEYVIVDGASTDLSIETIQQSDYSSNRHFTWISEPDTGVYQAMNKGIKMAKGEYVLFLNSGDFFVHKDVLQKVFSHHYVSDILCAGCNVSKDGEVVWSTNPPDVITFGTLYHVGLAHQSTFIKRSLFGTLGLYREDFRYNSDIDFWYRSIILHKASTEKVDVVLSNYNLDGISSIENHTERYQNEIKEILSQSNFNKFIPDYDAWGNKEESMAIYYWAKKNKLLNTIIKQTYKLAVWNNKRKKK